MTLYTISDKMIMESMNKKQTLELLRRAQRFQKESKCGMWVCTYYTDKGELWFHTSALLGEHYAAAECYHWRSYNDNLNALESFFQSVREFKDNSNK